jgi:hypothetical protein
MRMFSLALTVSSALLLPLGAYAGQQTTGEQSDLKTSIKARHPTYKRQQIIRAESPKQTTGTAPSHLSR